ncbi:MAG TPA: uracil-DNA glycosylase, partial [Burkholderiaceae bacterium]|nr:uracil-DNA glycosylase [Burkholderiaceae bacterium]
MQCQLASQIDFDGWRRQARLLAARAIPADEVHWLINGEATLLDDTASVHPVAADNGVTNEIRVPREFVELARKVVLHRSPNRFALLYRVLLRLTNEPELMQIDVDPDVMSLRVLERQVRHDEHRMHA